MNQIGKDGEKVAAKFLKDNGYKILATNFQNESGRRLGEIDIIVKDKKARKLVFVEVKTRDYQKYKDTLPEENITPSKINKLNKIANDYLRKNELEDVSFRFDAVSVWLDYESRNAKIKHLKNIYF